MAMQRIMLHSKLKFALVGVLLLVAILAPMSVFAGHGGSNSPELQVVSHVDFVPGPLGEGLISDVWALGNFAYVGSFDEPICSFDLTGVRIVDISNPADPKQVAFIKAARNTRNNDVKAAHLETSDFSGDILVVSNEPCTLGFIPRLTSFGLPNPPAKTGISIYNVTNPRRPNAMALNFLDFPVHNTFIYQHGDKAFLLAVDDVNLRDVHIVDITKPQAPVEIAVTGAPDWPPDIDNIGFGEIFLHDIWVQENNGKVIAYLSYWDAGLVLLDITNPANPKFLGDSDYLIPDPLSGQFPEGNSHVAAPTENGSLVIMGDEDFAPGFIDEFRVNGELKLAVDGGFTNPVFSLPNGTLEGTMVEIDPDGSGFACNGDPIRQAQAADEIALIQRGGCRFDEKATNAIDAGYEAMIVYNTDDPAFSACCEGLIIMSGNPRDIVGIFVQRSTGLAIRATLAADGEVNIFAHGTFDGWGYMRVLDVSDPGSIKEIGQFATERVLLNPPPKNVDLTAHNVIVRNGKAYWSWYHEGMRVVDFSKCKAGGGKGSCNPKEVAHFTLGPDGSNFWGVYVHDHPNGNTYILGSDRDSGLWIFDKP